MEQAALVTCFLRNRGDVLLRRPQEGAGPSTGRWDAVTLPLPEGEDPVAAAREHLGAASGACRLVRRGDPLTDDARAPVVHPLLFDCTRRVTLDGAASAAEEWVAPPAIRRRETVPGLWAAYDRVRPTVTDIADDDERGAATLSRRALAVLRDEGGLAADRDEGFEAVADVARDLVAARPAMVAVRNRVNRAMAAADRDPSGVEAAATATLRSAVDADEGAAAAAADLVAGERVVTLSRSGTVARALELAGPASVLVAESRPGAEGVGTAEDLAAAGLDLTLAPDAAVAHELATGKYGAVLVGADTMLPDGRVVNKVGTRGVALAAGRENVPVYAVAATDKVSHEDEPHLESLPPDAVYEGDADLAVAAPLFDVTPPEILAGVVTEEGRLATDDVDAIAARHRSNADW